MPIAAPQPELARPLTVKGVRARAVSVPLERPIVSKVGLFRDWPLILVHLYTHEGVVGHSYLEPYLERSARYIVPIIERLRQDRVRPVLPLEIRDGQLEVPDRPGQGIAWDEQAVARFAL